MADLDGAKLKFSQQGVLCTVQGQGGGGGPVRGEIGSDVDTGIRSRVEFRCVTFMAPSNRKMAGSTHWGTIISLTHSHVK